MSRSLIAALTVAAAAILSLAACAPSGHPGAQGSPRPHPTASHASAVPTPRATATPTPTTPPAARLSTSPGDELLTFTGTGRSTDGSVVAMRLTLHNPVAWNSAAGASTLAALAAGHSVLGGAPANDLRNTAWDAANAVSLAVVDYSATMTTGSWHPGEAVDIELGPGTSEVAVTPAGLATADGWWTITGPGSGHFVVAYVNVPSSTPDPSTWADEMEFYGFGDLHVTGNTPASYQLSGCHIDFTPLGRRAAAIATWNMPDANYCSAGIGD